MTDLLGQPTPDRWLGPGQRLARYAVLDLATIRAQIAGDQRAVMAAHPKRWWQAGGTNPLRLAAGFVPADMLFYRAMAAGAGLVNGDSDPARFPAGALALPAAMMSATPYLLTGAVAWGLSHTDIPDDPSGMDQVRLPDSAVSVWWPPMPIPTSELRPSALVEWQESRYDPGADRFRVDLREVPAAFSLGLTAYGPGPREVTDRYLLGVVLLADPDGFPIDEVIWVYAERGTYYAPDGSVIRDGWVWSKVVGSRSRAGLWQMLEALTAVVAWGDWVPDAPITIRNRAKLRRLRLQGFDMSKLGPVHVLDARHRATAGEVRDAEPGELRGPVRTHLRRGHWRRQRVGPRDEGATEMRWIAPTVVNPGGQPDDRPIAYRLLPPEKRLAPRWVSRRRASV